MPFILKSLRNLAWIWVKRWVRRQFPQVPSISTEDLAAWLSQDSPSPVLLDVRHEEEYAVSHLPGARRLTTVEAVQRSHISPEMPLVLYCSVGYRSARLAERLQAAGYNHVVNLEGSIFEWHNQGRPLVTDQGTVQNVHPYDRTWGLLLDSSR
ncbi:rhodanese-like domain-containing protein [Oscillatoria sp. CS-180]|uniref:rhodanese-like domain-containing protein n=1 Tax=Oscillatoria sp. CS-180 TaxID=3021720 RepID=UPI00232B1ACD|nr:rhodanese-like domain-containing protein [Oscillatoria sp. CS-180]MDB9529145.1 rhodanese-like domain-containing protein [Oscillatoria sp. CS-180]